MNIDDEIFKTIINWKGLSVSKFRNTLISNNLYVSFLSKNLLLFCKYYFST